MNVRSIRNEDDHEDALARIQELWGAKPGTPEGDEFDVLVTLVDAYEDEQYPIDSLDPIEAIVIRMDDLGLGRKDLEPCQPVPTARLAPFLPAYRVQFDRPALCRVVHAATAARRLHPSPGRTTG